MRSKPVSQQIYKHFKGNSYQIVCIAKDSETGTEMVVYQALYGDYSYYVRPLDMFMSEVDHAKYPDVKQTYRFEVIEDKPEVETGTEAEVETVDLDPDVLEFLDASTYEQRVDILTRMQYKITSDMIDIMSTVVDIEIKSGETQKRYEDFKNALLTRKQYETNRLR